MERAAWTYELPPAAADAEGLEDYEVETVDGEPVGKVKVVLRHGDDLLLTVESGVPPARSKLRAVSWTDVATVDHDAVTVYVKRGALARAIELEHDKAAEGGAAEATRVTAVPQGPAAVGTGTTTGPVDRPSYLVALALGLFGVFAALALIALGTATALGALWALAVIPVALLLLAGLFMYRFFRRPSEHI